LTIDKERQECATFFQTIQKLLNKQKIEPTDIERIYIVEDRLLGVFGAEHTLKQQTNISREIIFF